MHLCWSILQGCEGRSRSEWGLPARLMLLAVLEAGGSGSPSTPVSPWSPHLISSLQLGTNKCISK